jgi:hypothetical protein
MEIMIVIITFFLGIIGHEFDLSRNFKRDGDARAWFFKIKK